MKPGTLTIWPFTAEFLNSGLGHWCFQNLWHGSPIPKYLFVLLLEQSLTHGCPRSKALLEAWLFSESHRGGQNSFGHVIEKIKRWFKVKSPCHIGKTLQGHLAAPLFGRGRSKVHEGMWAVGHSDVGTWVLLCTRLFPWILGMSGLPGAGLWGVMRKPNKALSPQTENWFRCDSYFLCHFSILLKEDKRFLC